MNAFVLPWDFGRRTYVWTNSFALLSSFIYNICPTAPPFCGMMTHGIWMQFLSVEAQ
jgi:hypothetical protein